MANVFGRHETLPPGIDWNDAVALGLVDGVRAVRKYGFSEVLVSGSVYTVWPLASAYTFPTSSATLSCVSSSANDASGGSGLETITIDGLVRAADHPNGTDWGRTTETVTLTGATPAVTTKQFYRVNRVTPGTVGTYHGANAGNITITHGGTAAAIAYIPANAGQTQQLVYTVPAGETAVVIAVNVAPEATKSLNVIYRLTPGADDVTTPFISDRRSGNLYGADILNQTVLFARTVVPEKTDIEVQAQVASGGTTDSMSGGIQMHIYNNEKFGL